MISRYHYCRVKQSFLLHRWCKSGGKEVGSLMWGGLCLYINNDLVWLNAIRAQTYGCISYRNKLWEACLMGPMMARGTIALLEALDVSPETSTKAIKALAQGTSDGNSLWLALPNGQYLRALTHLDPIPVCVTPYGPPDSHAYYWVLNQPYPDPSDDGTVDHHSAGKRVGEEVVLIPRKFVPRLQQLQNWASRLNDFCLL